MRNSWLGRIPGKVQGSRYRLDWLDETVLAGNGHIYGVPPNGDLKWYRHLGWQKWTFIGIRMVG
jgi:hypothetical protein